MAKTLNMKNLTKENTNFLFHRAELNLIKHFRKILLTEMCVN